MSGRGILLVAEPAISKQVADACGDGELTSMSDPYDALCEMGRRSFPVVMLWGGDKDYESLCRAVRRLQPDARLIGLCHPWQEVQIAPLTPGPLDDYLLYPPDKGELNQYIGEYIKPQVEPTLQLSADEIVWLIDSVRTRANLEPRLAQLVGRKLDKGARWFESQVVADESAVAISLEEEGRCGKLCLSRPIEVGERRFCDDLQKIAMAIERSTRRTSALHRLAVTDDLTGAYNRRYFYHLTEQILNRDKNARVTLLLYDIDNFKQYNDSYGHAVGDEILKETAMLMREITRSHDIVARIGGDEFAVLFWDAQPRQANSQPPESPVVLANRFREAVNGHSFPSLGPNAVGMLTISGGLASYPRDGRSCAELLQSADEGLVSAKRSGKNSIRIVGSE